MKINSLNVLAILLILIIDQSFCQRDNYVVDIEQFMPSDASATTFRCNGAIVSRQHIFATATCAMVESPYELGFRFRTTSEEGFNLIMFFATMGAFIHPKYAEKQAAEFNVALIRTNLIFDETLNPPRPLGGLQKNTICQLFGWGSMNENPRRDEVQVFGPNSCDPKLPNIYCSIFITDTHATCTANLGSPVICSKDGNAIDGILINEKSCTSHLGRYQLNYISVDHVRDWINCQISSTSICDASGNIPTTEPPTTTQSGMAVKTSVALIVSAFLSVIFIKN